MDIESVQIQRFEKLVDENGVYCLNGKYEDAKYTFTEFRDKFGKLPVIKNEQEWLKQLESAEYNYADGIDGTLCDDDCNGWCIRSINRDTAGNLLPAKPVILGVNTPFVYVGTAGTTFALHCEDYNFASINYLHLGASKIWYSIPQCYASKLEAFVAAHFKCKNILQHKFLVIDPTVLRRHGIPVYKTVQDKGEFVITMPHGYHFGYNEAFNIAEATNFALLDWPPYGKGALLRRCRDTKKLNPPFALPGTTTNTTTTIYV